MKITSTWRTVNLVHGSHLTSVALIMKEQLVTNVVRTSLGLLGLLDSHINKTYSMLIYLGVVFKECLFCFPVFYSWI